MTRIHRLEDADIAGKRVLVRVDFNVPLHDGEVTETSRIDAALPTIRYLMENGARIGLISHLGRPGGMRDPACSLSPIQPVVAACLNTPVLFVEDCVGEVAQQAVDGLMEGGVALFENLRFHAEETANDANFAKAMADPFEVFVEDAFSVCHRAHASTEGVTHFLPSYAGMALSRELDHLSTVLQDPERPMMAVVGGAKVSSKIDVLMHLVEKADILAIGGGMANTFLHARGIDVGKSLNEPDQAETARKIMEAARVHGCEIMLPADVVVAEKFEANAPHRTVSADAVKSGEMILDAGPDTVDAIAEAIETANTLLWNGPLGAFEITPFDTATVEAAKYAGRRARQGHLVAVAGGGDTVAALHHAGAADDFTYISNAGGAFLEWVEGRALPGVEALKNK